MSVNEKSLTSIGFYSSGSSSPLAYGQGFSLLFVPLFFHLLLARIPALVMKR